MKKNTFRVLVLEDSEDDIVLMKEMMREIDFNDLTQDDVTQDEVAGTGCEVVYLDSLERGDGYLRSHPVDLLLLDLFLPDSRGLDTLKRVRDIPGAGDLPIVILTVLDDRETAVEAVRMGAQEYLDKGGITARWLCRAMRYALRRHRVKMQLKRETADLEKSEDRFLDIISSVPDGVVLVDRHNCICFTNLAARRLLAYRGTVFMGKPFGMPIPPEGQSLEVDIPRGDVDDDGTNDDTNEPLTLEMRGVDIEWKGEKNRLISLRDISLRKKMFRAYREEKEQLEIILRSIADAVIAVDRGGTVRLMNWMAGQMTGFSGESALGQPLTRVLRIKNRGTGELLTGEVLADEMSGHKLGGKPGLHDCVLLGDNREIPVECTCAPITGGDGGMVMVIRDVTEKKELQEELSRSRNLEALGAMAGGLAHKYNNLLTSTLGYVSLAGMSGEAGRGRLHLQNIEDAALRARDISNRLLTFSEGGGPRKERAPLMDTLHRAVEDIRNQFPITVTWRVNEPGSLDHDPQQVYLALYNILKNAAQAVTENEPGNEPGHDRPGEEGGGIEIQVDKVNHNVSRNVSHNLNQELKSYVKIAIIDGGGGISGMHRPRIFSPYFSTRPGAVGMGLTTAFSIIRKHNGWIRVKSTEGGGTRVTVMLPAPAGVSSSSCSLACPSPVSSAMDSSLPQPGGVDRKRVLVMDDEALVREIAGEMLEYLGYEALMAADGDEALAIYRSAMDGGGAPDVVILDLMVPAGMGGKECARKLLEIDPNAGLVISSAYCRDPVVADYRRYGFSEVLRKPYRIDELGGILRKLTDAAFGDGQRTVKDHAKRN